MPIVPTPITPLPTPPSTSDPVNFDTRADLFLGALPAFQTEANNLATNAYNNAVSADSSASAAITSAVDANNASMMALAAANFKGLWSSLTGALNKPATVKHNGKFWALLNNLANVAASQPGVSADWTVLDSLQVTQTISTNTTATAGVFYIVTTVGVTLTVPNTFTNGDYLGGRNTSTGACFIDWGSNTVAGQPPESPMRWPTLGRFETKYTGSTFA